MAEFNYVTKVFSGTVKEHVSEQVNTWLNTRQGHIEVVSSNMVSYYDPNNDEKVTFTVYSLFIEFPGYN